MTSVQLRPPRIGRLIVRLRALGARRDEIEADLRELFAIRAAEHGRRSAAWRYLHDALSLWRYDAGHRIRPLRHDGVHHMSILGLTQDVRFAARLFRRQPGLFGITVAGLAFAIGLSTAAFSVVNAVALRGGGIVNPEGVFRVQWMASGSLSMTGNSPFWGNWAYADFARLRSSPSSIDIVASTSAGRLFRQPTDSSDPWPVSGRAVSGDFFPLVGGTASLGRTLGPGDDVPGAPAVVVLSHRLWKNRLAADPAIVGKTIWLGSEPFTVIGVAARGFTGTIGSELPPALWITFTSEADSWTRTSSAEVEAVRQEIETLRRTTPLGASSQERLKSLEADLAVPRRVWNPAVDVIGRLKPGVTGAHSEAEMRALTTAIAIERGQKASDPATMARLQPVNGDRGDSAVIAAIFMGLVGLLVLLACANVTNVLLANAASRSREIGTRLALGAGRGRVVRQLLTESVLLGLAGGVAGLTLAMWTTPPLAALVQVPEAYDVTPDGVVYAFVALLTIGVGLIAGLAPARYGRSGDVLSALKVDQSAAPTPLRRGRLRSLLIGGQATVSIVLLVVAALLTRSLVRAAFLDLGFDADRLMTVSTGNSTNSRRWSPERIEAFWNTALAQIRQLPGVAGASLAGAPPFSGITASQVLPTGIRVNRNETTAEYFATVGIRVLRGRAYTADEVRNEVPVAVVSESLARAVWGEANPVGASMDRAWGQDGAAASAGSTLRRPKGTLVVGVVADAIGDLDSLRRGVPTIYLPLARRMVPRLVVRATGDVRSMERPVQDALRAANPDMDSRVTFASNELDRQLSVPKTLALLGVIAGGSALGLALVGLFGVTAFVVGQRRHEVTVRMALGASQTAIVQMLLRDSLRPVAIGLICGLVLALASGQLMQFLLYGVSGRDPVAILTAIAVLFGAALAAVLGPARQVARENPAQVLKQG